MRIKCLVFCNLAVLGSWAILPGQEPNPTQQNVSRVQTADPTVPIYRVEVVSRTTRAINYHHRQGQTTVGFRGTELLPQAAGKADVDSRTGSTKIEASFEKLTPARQFGNEFLTYVMWAITPEGRAENLGEVVLNGQKASLLAASELQAFGLIVTAEPYYAVTQPSDLVVMENFIRAETRGTIEPVMAKYQLLRRGGYTLSMDKSNLQILARNETIPLDLQEARNAVAIARAAGSEVYARDTLDRALVELQNAEGFYSSRADKKKLTTVAREATQHAEDARIITLRKRDQEYLAQQQASAERARAEASRAQADAAQADQERQRALAAAQQAEAGKRQESMRRQQAETEQARLAAQRAAAEAARRDAELSRQRAEQEQAALRENLRRQLNSVLETRETARGLIMNMSDVLFDVGQSTLKPEAREKLAKVSGILLAHPELRLNVEGHTDSTGSDEFNLELSQRRSDAVRAYMVSQGIAPESIVARGLGKSNPISSNDTSTGRRLNRRVELVVSGASLGAREVGALRP